MAELTLESIAKAIYYDENIKASYDEFINLVAGVEFGFDFLKEYKPQPYLMTVMGRPAIMNGRDVVVFVRCQWCGQRDGELDSYNCCAHCGGYL